MASANHTSKRKSPQQKLDTFYKYCFAVLFSLSLLGQYSLELFAQQQHTDAVSGKHLAFSKPVNDAQVPLDFPCGTEPDQLEMPEDGPESQSRDVWELSALPLSALWQTNEQSSFFHFVSHIENCETVSLIILHHSWKSFLI